MMHASEAPSQNFSNSSQEELNRMVVEQELQLTPRSKKSLLDRVKQLEITAESHEFINGFLHQIELRLSTMDNIFEFQLIKEYYRKHGTMPPTSHLPRAAISLCPHF